MSGGGGGHKVFEQDIRPPHRTVMINWVDDAIILYKKVYLLQNFTALEWPKFFIILKWRNAEKCFIDKTSGFDS